MFYRRFGPVIVFVGFAVAPLLIWCAAVVFASNKNDALDWLPKSYEGYDDLIWYAERFGSDEMLVITWQGCTIDDDRIDVMQDILRQAKGVPQDNDAPPQLLPAQPQQDDPQPLFRQVLSGRSVLRDITSEEVGVGEAEAAQRLQGWLVGPNGKTTCVVAKVSNFGVFHREQAVDAVYEAADTLGIDRNDLHLGGTTVDSVAIDKASTHGLFAMLVVSALGSLAIAWFCLRKFKFVAAVFVTAGIAWSASLTNLMIAETNMDAVLVVMPAQPIRRHWKCSTPSKLRHDSPPPT